MMSSISCRNKMNYSRNESPDLPSYPSCMAFAVLSHILCKVSDDSVREQKHLIFHSKGADPELPMRGWGLDLIKCPYVRTYPTFLERQA